MNLLTCITLLVALIIAGIIVLNVLNIQKLKPMTDRERDLVRALGKEIDTLNQQLWARNQEISQLRDKIKQLDKVRPEYGFDED